MITLAALNQLPHLFQSVVFAGVPFTGGISFLPDLTTGEPIGLNRRILSPEILGSFPSVYSLFPLLSEDLPHERKGTIDGSGFLLGLHMEEEQLGSVS